MLRQFLDPDGSSVHFIAPGQEESINPEWTELETPTTPPQPIEPPYFVKRSWDYPSVGDQLDMLWHMMDDEIIPGKGSEWYNQILAVKIAHPKPE